MFGKRLSLSVLCASVLLLTSCASSGVMADKHDQNDPFEGFNRAMFKFNDVLDEYVLVPVAKGYRAITTKDIRDRVNSAFSNLGEPVSAVNQVLQGEFKQSAVSLGRFVVNSTLGLGGTFDVATGWGWTGQKDNFDRTLATWCVDDGPYLVLPFMGPSTPRAALSKIADMFMSPVYWFTDQYEDGDYAYSAYIGAQTIAFRESTLELTDDLHRNSVDYYTTMRSAYMQNRSQLPNCNCQGDKSSSAAAYDFDFGLEEEDEIFDAMEEE